MTSALPPRTVRALRASAHALKPLVQVGDAGVSEGVIAETDRTLEDHELVKVRIAAESREAFRSAAQTLADATGAGVVQLIGRVVVLYRARVED